jgi:RimJ/RimL family protein N-acetyltransferase
MNQIETERLILRNWQDRDRDLFYEINSDDKVMAYFSFRRSRQQSDELMDRLRASIGDIGFGLCAVELKETGETLGMCGIAQLEMEPQFPQGTFETGWRFAERFWGKGYATESARAAIADGFHDHGLSEFVAFAVISNHRSTAVMQRIGMVRDVDGDFDHPGVPDDQPALIRHALYRLSRNQWARTLS